MPLCIICRWISGFAVKVESQVPGWRSDLDCCWLFRSPTLANTVSFLIFMPDALSWHNRVFYPSLIVRQWREGSCLKTTLEEAHGAHWSKPRFPMHWSWLCDFECQCWRTFKLDLLSLFFTDVNPTGLQSLMKVIVTRFVLAVKK